MSIRCSICGKKLQRLINHTMGSHGISIDEYRKMFPNDLIIDPNLQKRRTKKWKATLKKRYGVINTNYIDGIQKRMNAKREETNKKRYGVKNVMDIKKYRDLAHKRASKAIMDKYGVVNIMKIPEIAASTWKSSTRQPNKIEAKITSDLRETNIEFVGNGKFLVTFKCGKKKNPDFVIKPFSKSKRIIELFGERFHTEKEAKQIINKYKEIGINCLILWNAPIHNKKKNYKNLMSLLKYYEDLSIPSETICNPLGTGEDIVRSLQKCREISRNAYPLAQ